MDGANMHRNVVLKTHQTRGANEMKSYFVRRLFLAQEFPTWDSASGFTDKLGKFDRLLIRLDGPKAGVSCFG